MRGVASKGRNSKRSTLSEQARLHIDESEQEFLPGLASAGTKLSGPRPLVRKDSPAQMPLMIAATDEPAPWPPVRIEPGAGQLNLIADQLELTQVPPAPQQLALLPDPPLWEQEPEPVATPASAGRLARKRSRARISPGQGSLF